MLRLYIFNAICRILRYSFICKKVNRLSLRDISLVFNIGLAMKKLLTALCLLFFAAGNARSEVVWQGQALDEKVCQIQSGMGPYDYLKRKEYSKPDPHNPLYLVQMAHFTPEVENLIKGNTSDLEGDLDYTLRAYPNHHRALLSMIRYQLNIKHKIMAGPLRVPPECYLQRAIAFSPKDETAYSLFGYYLRKIGQPKEAEKYYEKAFKLNPKNAKVAYSYSLLLIDLKRYDDALKYAKIAYQSKGTPEALKQKLKKLKAWKE